MHCIKMYACDMRVMHIISFFLEIVRLWRDSLHGYARALASHSPQSQDGCLNGAGCGLNVGGAPAPGCRCARRGRAFRPSAAHAAAGWDASQPHPGVVATLAGAGNLHNISSAILGKAGLFGGVLIHPRGQSELANSSPSK